MSSDLRTLLWLQRRLLRNALRRGSAQDTGRLVGVLLLGLLMLPVVVMFSVGMGVGLRFADAELTGTIVAVVFSFFMLIWLITPASSQQMTEPLDLPKLFQHPIGFRSLVVGGLLINGASLASLATVVFLFAAIAGATRAVWHPLPMLVPALLFLLGLIVLKALIDDILSLAAEDRRLRMIFILISLAPVLLLVYGQLSFQIGFINNDAPPDPLALLERLDILRWLSFLPSGWLAQALLNVRQGAWERWLAWNLALLVLIGLGLMLHLRLMRQLYFGNLFRMAVRQKPVTTVALRPSRRLPFFSAQTSSNLLALLRKDWLNFARSPMTARLFFLPILLGLLAYFFSFPEAPIWAIGLGVGGFAAFMVTMQGHNQICTYDHVGVGALALSPAPRRLALFSYAVLNLGVVAAMALFGGVASLVRHHDPVVILIAVLASLLAQTILNGLSHLTSLVFPYYMDLERGQAGMNEAKSSFFTVFTVILGIPLLAGPIFLLLALAWALAPAYIGLAILLALVYAVAGYAILLYLAGRLFPSREERLVETMLSRR